ncbi:hypothetical protein N7539_008193 [Penicillium diatomitis]|uniref:Phosphatidylglycerol lysyltransferase C-terminal domain-containing protein n=1 Tax=Penicillium diatomitis TaxID=2819901 RepID=A0A9W9WTB5_9EURO|nr:uncharacterized protein N7539_008193 [Penicillium diatomitis]KAJ5475127.1 hypothetical protein N7539_008193 [Penicillium diatomitis]
MTSAILPSTQQTLSSTMTAFSNPDSLKSTPHPIICVTSAPDKKKRGRKGRKETLAGKDKKTTLVEELGEALVDQIHTITSTSPSPPTRISKNALVVDHLRNDFTSSFTIPSCPDSRNSSSRSCASDGTTSRETNISSASTLAPSVTGTNRPSTDSTQSRPIFEDECPPSRVGDAGAVFCLDDFATMTTIQRLTAQYGRVANMGILDPSYRFFVNRSHTGALSFKVRNKVAIVGGDPLCEPRMILSLLADFAAYRRKHKWGIAFMGASADFVKETAQPQGWTTIRFGTERVLNPQTNEVLLERSGKRIAVQNRQLLNPDKGGIRLGVYAPAVHGTDAQLQAELVNIYDSWRAERNASGGPQAFITVYDPFALPSLMTFIYSRGPDDKINGFAALRRLGEGGYHVDPCIAAPGAPKGISDLLIVSTMALLHRAGVSYLGFGFEPSHALGAEDVTGMSRPLASLTRKLYRHTFQRLPIQGKKAYNDKFRPDAEQDCGLYLVFPGGMPGPRQFLGMIHMANISLKKVLGADLKAWMSRSTISKQTEDATQLTDKTQTPQNLS